MPDKEKVAKAFLRYIRAKLECDGAWADWMKECGYIENRSWLLESSDSIINSISLATEKDDNA